MRTRTRNRVSWVVIALAALVASGSRAESPQTIELHERLGRRWERELLSYEVSFPPGVCQPDSVRPKLGTHSIPCQLSHIQYWPDEKFVKEATLSFLADLAPLGTNRYTLHCETEPAESEAAQTDLSVSHRDDCVEITTSYIGARFYLGSKEFPEGVRPSNVPGPLDAMRTADGKWFGGSSLFGKTKVTAYRGRITELGPVFAKLEYRYDYQDGNRIDLASTIVAGDNAVLWDVDIRKDSAGQDGVALNLSDGLKPLVFRTWVGSSSKRPEFRELINKRETQGHQRIKGNEATEDANQPQVPRRLWTELPLAHHPPGIVTSLSPWENWWDEGMLGVIRLLRTDAESELRICRRNSGDWVEPAPPGERPAVPLEKKLLPLEKTEAGEVLLKITAVPGRRHFSIIDYAPQMTTREALNEEEQADAWRFLIRRHSLIGRHLNEVKDYCLAWEDKPGPKHPHLFMTEEDLKQVWARGPADAEVMRELLGSGSPVQPYPHSSDGRALAAYLLTGSPEMAHRLKLPERLRTRLAMLGQYDLMRATLYVAALYDALIDSQFVSPEERTLYRAQMAYLAYKVAHPDSWSVWRGYRSGNPNMSVSYVLSLGMLGCLLPDHPMAGEWVREALEMMDLWMNQVGPKGEWYESFHYTDVSVRVMVVFAIAARNAGFRDYFREGTLKKLGNYTAAFYTPRDPQRNNVRCGPPLGRSNAGGTYGLQAALARATVESDPEYSAQMQWLWERTGFSTDKQIHRFGGWEYVYFDKTLPTRKPEWETDLFPQVGALMRHGLDSPYEHYLAMFTNSDCKFARGSEKGAIVKLFLKGRPIGGSPVGGYWHRHSLLMNCVTPASRPVERAEDLHPYGYEGASELTGFAATPRLDYVGVRLDVRRPWDTWKWRAPLPDCLLPWTGAEKQGKPPYRWHRQVLFIKDDDPAAANYLLLRDTVRGGQPTFWHFWTLSEKIGTPEQVRNREAFLADKPGDSCVAARRLVGDRFTALGQFDVDLEYYIASPAETPRYTLRLSDTYTYPISGFVESQDALHLELPGDGTYFVALFPRFRGEAVPKFQSIGDGRVIQVEGPWGSDLGFLSDTPSQVSAAGAEFRGTAAAVQDRHEELVLSLADEGRLRYKAFEIQSDGPATIRIYADRLAVDAHRYHTGQRITILTQEALTPSENTPRTLGLARTPEGYELSLAEGISSVELARPLPANAAGPASMNK